jgi:multiple sugar transport system permease protein/raffinose/stachyose/melibiose transport system permease protein
MRSRKFSSKPVLAIVIFIAPVMLYYATFIIYPIFATIYNSFHSMVPRMGSLVTRFVGLANYTALFSDEIFLLTVKNTIIWATVGPALEMAVAVILAFLVYFKVPFHRFYRAAWFSPILVTGVIVGVVFKWIFNFDWGLLNAFLRRVGLDSLAKNWLGSPNTALWVAIFVHFWNTFGYSFILLLAGLSTVNAEVIESASLDGASKWKTCLHILLPMLMPVFITTTILSFMGKMRAFHVVWVLTNGGPMHATETVATYVQKRAFGWASLDLGYPSAISVFWFMLVVIGVSAINRRLQKGLDS